MASSRDAEVPAADAGSGQADARLEFRLPRGLPGPRPAVRLAGDGHSRGARLELVARRVERLDLERLDLVGRLVARRHLGLIRTSEQGPVNVGGSLSSVCEKLPIRGVR